MLPEAKAQWDGIHKLITELDSGQKQAVTGPLLEILTKNFLKQFEPGTVERMEELIAKLHGVKKYSRFRDKTVALMAWAFAMGRDGEDPLAKFKKDGTRIS